MCFTIPRAQKVAKRATKDIPCIKILYPSSSYRSVYRSPYMNFKYEKGFKYSNDNFIKERKNYPRDYNGEKSGYGEGIHSYMIGSNKMYIPYRTIKLKCYIPKGAYYFSNRNEGVYFSDRLVIPK